MRVMLVSSPGAGTESHWSHARAAVVAECLSARGATVAWVAVARPGQSLPPTSPSVAARTLWAGALLKPHRVAADSQHLPVEVAVTQALREAPARAVVHLGAGARGSPNIAWLAERLGAAPFAVVRAAEVVCHRGDLVDHTGVACEQFLDAQRCRRCCAGSWWQRPGADDFRNRGDLLAGSLLVCSTVFTASELDIAPLVAFGLPRRSLVVATDPDVLAAAILS